MASEPAERKLIVILPLAGSGTRLHPVTKFLPKPMIPLAGKTVLEHILEKIDEITSLTKEFCFVLGHKHAMLREFITKIMPCGGEIHFLTQNPSDNSAKRSGGPSPKKFSGLGDAIALAAPWAAGRDCLIVLGDRLPLLPYSTLIDHAIANRWDGAINATEVDRPEHYGICEIDPSQLILGIQEKPPNPRSNLAISGAYYLRSSISQSMFRKLQAQAQQPFDGVHEHDFTNILHQLIEEGAKLGVKVHPKDSPILDLGRPESLLIANKILLSQERRKNQCPAEITVSGNVSCGTSLTSERTSLGPDVSIGTNCILKNCTFRNAILGDNVQLTGIEASDVICPSDTVTSTFQERSLLTTSNGTPNPAPNPKKHG